MKCIICGKNEAYKHGMCSSCLADQIRLQSSKMEITVCPKCGALKINKKWYYNDTENVLKRQALGHINIDNGNVESINNLELSDDRIIINIDVNSKTLGMVNKTAEIDLKILKESCPVCNKVTGSYYEGIIQLRTFSTEFDSRLNDAKDLIVSYVRDLNRDNPNSFISRIENKREGIDIYLGRKEDAIKIDKLLNSMYFTSMKQTKSLAGRKDGKDIFRYTHLIRILDVTKGSILFDKKYYMVTSISANSIGIMDLDTQTTENITQKEFYRRNFNIIRKEPLIDKFIVISTDGGESQIMNSETYKIITVRQVFDSKEVSLYKYRDRYYSM
ncbi:MULTISPECIES: 60S ribosomal export protein NMD3 [Acidiplasma]|jgi:nonsense-mediated mRNA decay protein 3|uniref:Nmd3 N-terminal domain-containing protein n=3 Tax=Acidiplasma TaxID=507753 RepID=A0A0Q0VJG9_9ARCH|nr:MULTISPECIES: NMD3-related protein [Acidiplasma]KJE49140.1 hypothetical protein TZ01_03330 [Acidiplasma sp. MBA-1]KPV46867.1 hypothetical protein SE19_03655 [Acidiplasma aeolicum]KQB33650.1 hypothetical protein AOG55_02395 [Acidiplasma cupricumulans]KQB34691.1 hypothetical protein AOG54_03935 [Acidiplasma aeolicum]WMT54927.1 MAG: NMD3-related protein [Acidiplasma sp.]